MRDDDFDREFAAMNRRFAMMVVFAGFATLLWMVIIFGGGAALILILCRWLGVW